MKKYILKRDGRRKQFDKQKIVNAIKMAFESTQGEEFDEYAETKANNIADYIEQKVNESENMMSVEDIQDLVENGLMSCKKKNVAKQYILYRDERRLARENTIDKDLDELFSGNNEYWNTENSNKDVTNITVQRDYVAGITSTDITRRYLLPKEVVKAHDDGIIHFHDADYFIQRGITNCELTNLEDMLQNGTVINKVAISKPHSLLTACTIATQIITAVSSSTYGGQTITLSHLAPFVRISYDRYLQKYKKLGLGNRAEELANIDLRKEIRDSVQTFNYQINSMSTTNGQSPFISVFMYISENKEYEKETAMLIEEFLNQRIKGMPNEQGVMVTQAFPKLLYVLDENNITEDSEYWYLTQLACKSTAKRMNPDYISAKVMRELKGDVYPCMGCRSFLTPDRYTDTGLGNIEHRKNYDGKHQYYGRGNMGVVTLNLADLGLSANGDYNKFWKLFDERSELIHKALQCRYNRIKDVKSDIAPILWQYGAFARLKKGEPIGELLKHGRFTISYGYAGLYECVKAMTGYSHTNPNGEKFAIEVMKAINDKCNKWKAEEDIDYSPYGSPIEATTGKFAEACKRHFGEDVFIKLDGHDRNYITNSVHVPPFEEIDPFTKISLEAQFQKYSAGGYVQYIESANLTNNLDVVMSVIKYMYENSLYAEINIKSDYCQKCGYDGEIKIIDVDGKLDWECPQCGNRDHKLMNVSRRTCGYIGTNFWSQSRTEDIHDRYVHLDDHTLK